MRITDIDFDQLSPNEWDELAARVALHTTSPGRSYGVEQADLWNAIDAVCAIPQGRMEKFVEGRGGYGRAKFDEKCAMVDGFIKRATGNTQLDRPRRQELLRRLMHCFVVWRRDRFPDSQVKARILLDDLESLDCAVDAAFPGYAKAGLLHQLVRLAA